MIFSLVDPPEAQDLFRMFCCNAKPIFTIDFQKRQDEQCTNILPRAREFAERSSVLLTLGRYKEFEMSESTPATSLFFINSFL